jgi:hypothetical protein
MLTGVVSVVVIPVGNPSSSVLITVSVMSTVGGFIKVSTMRGVPPPIDEGTKFDGS